MKRHCTFARAFPNRPGPGACSSLCGTKHAQRQALPTAPRTAPCEQHCASRRSPAAVAGGVPVQPSTPHTVPRADWNSRAHESRSAGPHGNEVTGGRGLGGGKSLHVAITQTISGTGVRTASPFLLCSNWPRAFTSGQGLNR